MLNSMEWAEQCNENIDDYDEVFGELHEKYNVKQKWLLNLNYYFKYPAALLCYT